MVGEVFFIIIFTYFYTAVTFNPVDQADNLKKYGGFIPGRQTRADLPPNTWTGSSPGSPSPGLSTSARSRRCRRS